MVCMELNSDDPKDKLVSVRCMKTRAVLQQILSYLKAAAEKKNFTKSQNTILNGVGCVNKTGVQERDKYRWMRPEAAASALVLRPPYRE